MWEGGGAFAANKLKTLSFDFAPISSRPTLAIKTKGRTLKDAHKSSRIATCKWIHSFVSCRRKMFQTFERKNACLKAAPADESRRLECRLEVCLRLQHRPSVAHGALLMFVFAWKQLHFMQRCCASTLISALIKYKCGFAGCCRLRRKRTWSFLLFPGFERRKLALI